MPEVFLISDTHFGHKNIINFKSDEGRPMRPFETLDEMHACMIERWNAAVRPQDLVYHLGDVAFGAAGLALVGSLNGRKRLVRGNHDTLSEASYREHFQRVYGVKELGGMVLSHIPLHPVSLKRWGCNVHGHLHNERITYQSTTGEFRQIPDPRYLCVSVEQTDYAPVPLYRVREKLMGEAI